MARPASTGLNCKYRSEGAPTSIAEAVLSNYAVKLSAASNGLASADPGHASVLPISSVVGIAPVRTIDPERAARSIAFADRARVMIQEARVYASELARTENGAHVH